MDKTNYFTKQDAIQFYKKEKKIYSYNNRHPASNFLPNKKTYTKDEINYAYKEYIKNFYKNDVTERYVKIDRNRRVYFNGGYLIKSGNVFYKTISNKTFWIDKYEECFWADGTSAGLKLKKRDVVKIDFDLDFFLGKKQITEIDINEYDSLRKVEINFLYKLKEYKAVFLEAEYKYDEGSWGYKINTPKKIIMEIITQYFRNESKEDFLFHMEPNKFYEIISEEHNIYLKTPLLKIVKIRDKKKLVKHTNILSVIPNYLKMTYSQKFEYLFEKLKKKNN